MLQSKQFPIKAVSIKAVSIKNNSPSKQYQSKQYQSKQYQSKQYQSKTIPHQSSINQSSINQSSIIQSSSPSKHFLSSSKEKKQKTCHNNMNFFRQKIFFANFFNFFTQYCPLRDRFLHTILHTHYTQKKSFDDTYTFKNTHFYTRITHKKIVYHGAKKYDIWEKIT
jgi:hypothetical protein